jgi:hypothetical protein
VAQRRVGVVEPSEDERLDEGGAGELSLSPDEAGAPREAIGGASEDVSEGVGEAG